MYSPFTHIRALLKRSGFGLVEVVVGVSLLTLVLVYTFSASATFLSAGRLETERTQALYLTEETLESVRFVRDTNWTSFQALPLNTNLYIARAGSITATTAPQTVGVFTPVFRLYAVNRDASTKDIVTSGGAVDTGTRFITATTTWSKGSVALSTYVADISK